MIIIIIVIIIIVMVLTMLIVRNHDCMLSSQAGLLVTPNPYCFSEVPGPPKYSKRWSSDLHFGMKAIIVDAWEVRYAEASAFGSNRDIRQPKDILQGYRVFKTPVSMALRH